MAHHTGPLPSTADPVTTANAEVHRVVIVGGGFGGLFAAKFLRRAAVEVTLVDARNYHLFQPLLYQLATGILSVGEVAPPIRGVLRRHANVTVELATVTEFDLAARTVTARRPDDTVRTYEYDSLIVAAGAAQSYFGHDEFARFAPGMKTIDDALELRGRIFGAFEMAENETDPETRRTWLTFVVVGGGPTGVEIAGQIAELSRWGLTGNFRRIDPAQATVELIDGGKEILATFGDRLSEKAARELRRIGVTIRTGTIVTGVDAFGVDVRSADGSRERILPRTKIWAAGVQASPLAGLLAQASGATCDRAGRIVVREDCTLPAHPEVFAIGDMMALDDLPGVAEVAMQSGIHAANTIKRRLRGKKAARFTYRDLGSMATISRFHAVVSFKGIRVSGFLGWLMWLVVHITFLTGFKNRLSAVFHWMNTFLAGGRAERTITLRQVIGRVALADAGGETLTRDHGATPEQHRRDDSGSGSATSTTSETGLGRGTSRAD
jgi:NADH dehydrogenase